MRRNLAVLAIFVLGSGFHHHHHSGHSSSSSLGCGSVEHVSTSEWKLDGLVRSDTSDPASATALVHVRALKGGAPVSGAAVTVNTQRLVEVAPGEYLGPVHVDQGSWITIEARGSSFASATGFTPQAAQNVALSADGASVTFDERGPADRLEVIAHGATDVSQTTESFEEDARIQLAVPSVASLRQVAVRVEASATSPDELSRIELEAESDVSP